MIATTTPPTPTDEHSIQAELFRWLANHPDPRTGMAFAIPNGARVGWKTAKKLGQEGLRAGVPDVMIATACGGYHGLYVELKRPKTDKQEAGQVKPEQRRWINALIEQGYKAEVCYWLHEAQQVINEYLALTPLDAP